MDKLGTELRRHLCGKLDGMGGVLRAVGGAENLAGHSSLLRLLANSGLCDLMIRRRWSGTLISVNIFKPMGEHA
jgi:hypothetical protein